MKYYIEEETKELREALEAEILEWSLVPGRKMMGCPCYMAKGKMFFSLVTEGIIFRNLDRADQEVLREDFAGVPFDKGGGKLIKSWIHVHVEDPADLHNLMPYVERSYEGALKKADE